MAVFTTTTFLTFGFMAETKDLKTLERSIIINASADKVWSTLIDFENWENWNSFIVKSEGKAEVGSTLRNTFDNDGKEMIFKPKVLKAEPNRELVWKGQLFIPGIFDGTHGFRIEELGPNQVRFVNYESFKGLFSGMILKKIYDDTASGFERMNQELKTQVEQS